MNEERFRTLYCDTMNALHAPADLVRAPSPRPRRRPPVLVAAAAVALAACSAVAVGGITLRNLDENGSGADSAFTARIELPLTAPDGLPAAIRQAAAEMQPWTDYDGDPRYMVADEGVQIVEYHQFQLTPDTGLDHGGAYAPGEALLPVDSWAAAGQALGWELPVPAVAGAMNEITGALTNADPDTRYKALVRVGGDTATGTIECVSAETRWSGPQGRLSLTVYGLVGEGETGTLDTTFRFWMGDTTWQPEDYAMANGATATIAVPDGGYNPNGLWAYFVDDGKLCLVHWNDTRTADTACELADLQAVLDSFA